MQRLLRKTITQILKEAKGKTREEIAYRVLPHFLLELMRRYLRVEVEGLENIPKEGPYIIIANHSGFMGFDALMLSHQVQEHTGRVPRIIAHKLWFLRPEIAVPAKKMGMIPATFKNGLKILEQGHPLLLFPEGEEGNFKPTAQRYRLRRFRRGFIRLALKTGVPIIPAVVVGAEETHITLSQIRWFKHLLGVLIPVPLNVIPLPARWHIKFGTPIKYRKAVRKAEDIEYVTRLSKHIRTKLQRQLSAEVRKRKFVFL